MVNGMSKAIAVGTVLLSIGSIGSKSAHLGLSEAKADEGKQLTDVFISNNSGDANMFSDTAKKWYFEALMDQNVLPVYHKIKNVGYIAAKETAKYAIPLGLAAGAWWGGPYVGTACAGVLLLMGAKTVLHDVIGIGKKE